MGTNRWVLQSVIAYCPIRKIYLLFLDCCCNKQWLHTNRLQTAVVQYQMETLRGWIIRNKCTYLLHVSLNISCFCEVEFVLDVSFFSYFDFMHLFHCRLNANCNILFLRCFSFFIVIFLPCEKNSLFAHRIEMFCIYMDIFTS